MNMNDIDSYRSQKDAAMRGNEPDYAAREQDRYSMDMFGGQNGVDPSSHGAELQ